MCAVRPNAIRTFGGGVKGNVPAWIKKRCTVGASPSDALERVRRVEVPACRRSRLRLNDWAEYRLKRKREDEQEAKLSEMQLESVSQAPRSIIFGNRDHLWQ